MTLKVIIVGGVAGGATAAARLRRINEEAEIIIYEKGEYISCANCGLPYYIGDVIPDKGELLLQTPASMWKRSRVDVHVNSEVVRIMPDSLSVPCRLLSGSHSNGHEIIIFQAGRQDTGRPDYRV